VENLSLSGLQESERRLLAVFARHGRDGRGITIESLAVNAGMSASHRELTSALQSLIAHGLIKPAGEDPIPGAPLAFRLARPITERHSEAQQVQSASRRAALQLTSEKQKQDGNNSASAPKSRAAVGLRLTGVRPREEGDLEMS